MCVYAFIFYSNILDKQNIKELHVCLIIYYLSFLLGVLYIFPPDKVYVLFVTFVIFKLKSVQVIPNKIFLLMSMTKLIYLKKIKNSNMYIKLFKKLANLFLIDMLIINIVR